MDNYQGDLTDILRASTGGALGQSDVPVSDWEFPSDPMNLASPSIMGDSRVNGFGDPFCNMRDPLLHELNVAGSSYFSSRSSADHVLSTTSVDQDHTSNNFAGANSAAAGACSNILARQKVLEDHAMHKAAAAATSNVFSRIQISPNNPTKLPVSPCNSPAIATCSSPGGFKPSAMVSSDIINVNNSKGCLIDSTGSVQISSPRNLGIKRRKSQAKKVVCIPAPAAANSRSSGEVVPSDLWAWRKYGQKPIKGSPYPRGYYRCSSSKGCSARKQVERSRNDPKMLVITYTSEHNHPWPTQRNALAGSTRSQPTKNGAAPKGSTASTKEDQKEGSNDTLSPADIGGGSSSASAYVKEEFDEIEKQMEMEDDEFMISTEGFSHNYRPSIPAGQSDQDLFAELGEIDADPLDLLFTQDFNGEEQEESKASGPIFSVFDNWSEDTNTSFGQAGRPGL
ncbi:WRKY transcription factor [Salix suchowensis]|nr:WRKY transcription factor [Salix suchowensis]